MLSLFGFALAALLSLVLLSASSCPAAVIVFSNLTTPGTSGYAEPVGNNLILGDSLTLTQGGPLSVFGATVFNSNTSAGAILAGSMLVNFYDNSIPYVGPGPITNPLLGSTVLPWDFSDISGLQPGFFDTKSFDMTSLDINLPINVLVTQQFTQTAGMATAIGAALLSDPTIGSSPDSFYLSSSVTPENLYSRSGNPGQFGYEVEVVPEPSLSASLLILAALPLFQRRNRTHFSRCSGAAAACVLAGNSRDPLLLPSCSRSLRR